jgi:hypothetical protein
MEKNIKIYLYCKQNPNNLILPSLLKSIKINIQNGKIYNINNDIMIHD